MDVDEELDGMGLFYLCFAVVICGRFFLDGFLVSVLAVVLEGVWLDDGDR
jgi:hypothetical protein